MLAIAFWGSSIYHKDTSTAKHLSIVLPLAYKCQRLTCLTSELATVPGCPDSHRQPPQDLSSATSGMAAVLGLPGMCNPTHQVGQQPPQKAGPGSQPGQGPAPPTSTSTVVGPTTTEGSTQSTSGHP